MAKEKVPEAPPSSFRHLREVREEMHSSLICFSYLFNTLWGDYWNECYIMNYKEIQSDYFFRSMIKITKLTFLQSWYFQHSTSYDSCCYLQILDKWIHFKMHLINKWKIPSANH